MTVFIPLQFRHGEAYQFDWSHQDVEIAGEPMRVKVAHMRLCASRAVYVRAVAAALLLACAVALGPVREG